MNKILRDILITLAIALVIFFALRATVQPYKIFQTCMEPNFYEGEWVMSSKATYWCHEPERGDVIILDPPFDTEEVYIKRVIAIPGDTVEIKDGLVYVDGTVLEEPYVMEPPTYTYPPTTLGEEEYFVLGDNRNVANDSHQWGILPRENIIAKAWFVYWPFSEWGGGNHYPLGDQLEPAAE